MCNSVSADFAVWFADEDDGFAHVIEDETAFSDDFGLEVLCGMLGEPAAFVMRQKPEPAAAAAHRVSEFRQRWQRFDWTSKLIKNQ
jgi:hypothetical protein